MAKLVLVRHGQSEWNAKNICTGLVDIGLTEKGHADNRTMAEQMRDIRFDVGFTSAQQRAQSTIQDVLEVLGQTDIRVQADPALNERDYGELTGKNKQELAAEYGEEYQKWRRGWDYPVPGGETLEDTYNRTVPYYKDRIVPELEQGSNVLISAHGNSLRALVKYLDNISDEDIAHLEFPFGQVRIYEFADGGVKLLETRETIAA